MKQELQEEIQKILTDYVGRITGGDARPDQAIPACAREILDTIEQSEAKPSGRRRISS